ncbi:MAG: VWA domain-containing protein [Candidatus Margulisbacteria bacterium]|nr:VWA domain-containing protein [Candidatus Margulisiibacteriota bacterium]
MYKEGTARWAEDSVNDAYNRYNKEVPDYLNDTTVSHFDVANRYETVLFWKYMTEQHGAIVAEPQVGVDAMISLWNNLSGTVTSTEGLTAIETTINGLTGGASSLNETFSNFAVANYVKDLADPYGDATFEYLEDEEARNPGGNVYTSVMPLTTETLNSQSGDYTDTESVNDWGLNYHVFDIESSVQDINVTLSADAGFTEPFWRVIAVRGADATTEGSTDANWEVSVVNDITDEAATPVDQVVVIVGAYNTGGDYDITVSVNEGIPSVMLVLDHSGSMASQEKMDSLHTAASLFIDLAETNGVPGVGAVGFSTTASVLPDSDLTELDGAKAADVISDIEDLSPTDMTSIGAGLEEARTEFDGDPVDAQNETIVLISDGIENTDPLVSTIQGDLVSDDLTVYSVGLGTDSGISTDALEDVANATGGDYLMTDDADDLTEFYLQILASVIVGDLDGDGDSDADSDTDSGSDDDGAFSAMTSVVSSPHSVNRSGQKKIQVLSSDTRLNAVITWKETNTDGVGIGLVGPGQKVITQQSLKKFPSGTYKTGKGYAFISIPLGWQGAHAGTWYAYPVLPEGASGPVQLKAVLKSGLDISTDIQDTFYTGDPINFKVDVTESLKGVSHATVTISSDKPLNSIGTFLSTDINFKPKPSEFKDGVDAISQKLEELIDQTDSNPLTERDTNEFTLTETAPGTGKYTNTLYSANVEGSYHFTLKVKGQNELGEKFTRYRNFTKVVRVKPSSVATPVSTVKAKEANSINITLTPTDSLGNKLGPGHQNQISFVTKFARPTGDIKDNLDGSYSQTFTVTDASQAVVSAKINGELISVPTKDIQQALASKGNGTSPSHNFPLWIALLALFISIIALILAVL